MNSQKWAINGLMHLNNIQNILKEGIKIYLRVTSLNPDVMRWDKYMFRSRSIWPWGAVFCGCTCGEVVPCPYKQKQTKNIWSMNLRYKYLIL